MSDYETLLNYHDELEIIRNIELLSEDIHQQCVAKGFWDMGIQNRNSGEAFMLMVTELAEGFEGIRKGNAPDDHIPEFTCEEAELADVVIRIFDWACARKLRLGKAIIAKHTYNRNRPYKHGKKF